MPFIYAGLAHSYPLNHVTVIYDPEHKIKGATRGEAFTLCAIPSSDIKTRRLSDFKLDSLPFTLALPKNILKEVRSIDNLLTGAEKGALLEGIPIHGQLETDLVLNTEDIKSDKHNFYFNGVLAKLIVQEK